MTELLTEPYIGYPERVKFYMKEIEVDGIPGSRSPDLHTNLFFTLKQEEDERGNPDDTGNSFRWIPDLEISEKHWLSCRVIIPKHSRCDHCNKRDLDE